MVQGTNSGLGAQGQRWYCSHCWHLWQSKEVFSSSSSRKSIIVRKHQPRVLLLAAAWAWWQVPAALLMLWLEVTAAWQLAGL